MNRFTVAPFLGLALLVYILAAIQPLEAQQIPQALINLQQDIGRPFSGWRWSDCRDNLSVFARTPGQERWQLKNLAVTEQQQKRTYQNLTELGFIHEVKPSHRHYEAAVVGGATVPAMIRRIKYLISLWEQGVRFDKIILMAGQRPLGAIDNVINEITTLQSNNQALPVKITLENMPRHEGEAQRLLFQLMHKPTDMAKVALFSQDCQRHLEPDAKTWIRPNTSDTFKQLINLHPQVKQFLIVTSQPYVPYIDAIYKSHLSEMTNPPQVDTVGPAALASIRMVQLLNATYDWLKVITPLVEADSIEDIKSTEDIKKKGG